MNKTLAPMKATLLDDDAFRLLALPYGGPIPFPGAPKGADLDRQWMTEQTDFGQPPGRVDVTWHHGSDPTGVMGREIVGKASDLEFDEYGGWVKVWLDHGKRRTRLIKALAEAAKDDDEVDIFGSSEAVQGSGRLRMRGLERSWRPRTPGEITRWHYAGQTLSTSPQNTLSVLTPVKATLADLSSGDIDVTPDYFDDLSRWLDNLAPNPAPTPAAHAAGDGEAKAGRVLAGRNEARLREAIGLLDGDYDATFSVDVRRRKEAVGKLRSVLAELENRGGLLRSVEL